MTFFYKGVGVGTYLHTHSPDLRSTGIVAAVPQANSHASAVIRHIRWGAARSPYISVTRSYAVALDYARNGGTAQPTRSAPAYVYEIDVPDPLPQGRAVLEPIEIIGSAVKNPLMSPSYHNSGGPELLLGIVDPIRFQSFLNTPAATPPGLGPSGRPPNVSDELRALVNALRDAEALVIDALPQTWITHRYDVY
ncbi:MAG: hypothetical protein ACLPN5_18590 [Roseiarcus sp.]